jgi:hypothetical protein
MHKGVHSILLLLLLLVPFQSQTARQYVTQGKTDPVKISYQQGGILKLQSATAQGIVNLKNDIPGCLRQYDGSARSPRPASTDGISLRVLDEVLNGDKVYLVLQINTGSGCNVQGMCGAGEEIVILWLQFNNALKRERFQSALVVSCLQNIELEQWKGNRPDLGELKLEMEKGRLALKYARFDYSKQSNAEQHYTLVYDRAAPQRGLQISETKTQK